MLAGETVSVKTDKFLSDSGWNIISRDAYISFHAFAVKEVLMKLKRKAADLWGKTGW